MRHFSFNDYDSDALITWSEAEILNYYWDHWKDMMLKRGFSPTSSEITEQNCIDEFVVVYWAWEVFPKAPSGWDDLTNVR
jgi:hypothetical protein